MGGTSGGFGWSVSISGNTLVVGQSLADFGMPEGAAYVFTEPASGWTNMTQTAELTAVLWRRVAIWATRFQSAATRSWSERTAKRPTAT